MACNDRMSAWFVKCNDEAKGHLDVVLSDAKSWDALWRYAALMERNAEISESEKYF